MVKRFQPSHHILNAIQLLKKKRVEKKPMSDLNTPKAKGLIDPSDLGIIHKFDVKKVNDPEGKHDYCWYFVLDPQHDPHARIALAAYAVDCAPHYPRLAEDLRKVLGNVTNA